MEATQASQVRQLLREEADPEKAALLLRFFKTGPGEYGEGDRFLGVTVPKCRKIARSARGLSWQELRKLLRSEWHEEREVALFVMVEAFKKAKEEQRRAIYARYVQNLKYVNNWDLVDASAPALVGGYLADKSRQPLLAWARSTRLWERRVAMVATFQFIRQGDFADALKIATILLDDDEDLIHKAAGWMLREIGKRELAVLERFLARSYSRMPRTMLRYAIEKFPEARRQAYLKGTV